MSYESRFTRIEAVDFWRLGTDFLTGVQENSISPRPVKVTCFNGVLEVNMRVWVAISIAMEMRSSECLLG